jgi:hypothetical protein
VRDNTVQTFITRPELVEAVKVKATDFTGDHPNDNHMPGVIYAPSLMQAIINGSDGQQAAVVGDWIVRDTDSNVFRLKPREFEERYTPTNDSVLDAALKELHRLHKRIEDLEGRSREATPGSPRPAA